MSYWKEKGIKSPSLPMANESPPAGLSLACIEGRSTFLEPLDEHFLIDQTKNRRWPMTARTGRSSSLFTDAAASLIPWRRGNQTTGRKPLVRRFSSPVLSRCGGFQKDKLDEPDFKRNCFDDPLTVAARERMPEERELVSRSVSLRLDGDSDLCESFCPSDLEIKELLGKGFYGEVFKVIHRRTGRPMVMKRLYRLDAKCETDFIKEAAVMRQLHHPNVLRFLGVLYNDKKLHLITEYISGGTLRSLLESVEVLTWFRRLAIAHDVACGMAYLQSKNVIHRDLNTGNILIREEDGSAVVADFGLARILGRRRAGRRRRLTVVGDPYLMAPEMSKEECYNESVDVFSYGVTLCEIIGRCSSDPDVMPRRQDFGIDEERFVSKFVNDSCPRPFLELAFKCATVNADDRPSFLFIERWLIELLENFDSSTDEAANEINGFGVDTDKISNSSISYQSPMFLTPGRNGSSQKRRKSVERDQGKSEGHIETRASSA